MQVVMGEVQDSRVGRRVEPQGQWVRIEGEKGQTMGGDME